MFESRITQRVRYAETDRMGVVYYANYLVWFEIGRNEYFRGRDLPYADVEARGYFLPVSEVRCRILQPARFDDEVTVRTTLAEVKSRSLKLAYRIERAGELLAQGETVHVCVNGDQKVTRIPEWMKIKLTL